MPKSKIAALLPVLLLAVTGCAQAVVHGPAPDGYHKIWFQFSTFQVGAGGRVPVTGDFTYTIDLTVTNGATDLGVIDAVTGRPLAFPLGPITQAATSQARTPLLWPVDVGAIFSASVSIRVPIGTTLECVVLDQHEVEMPETRELMTVSYPDTDPSGFMVPDRLGTASLRCHY